MTNHRQHDIGRPPRPQDRQLCPGDLLASIYQTTGVDPAGSLIDKSRCPIPILPEGQPIRELF